MPLIQILQYPLRNQRKAKHFLLIFINSCFSLILNKKG